MKKRILSILLALVMLLSLLPAGVFATEVTASGSCGDAVTWSLDAAGVLTISGTGNMTNYNGGVRKYAPWDSYSAQITKVVIESGVTSIGSSAFEASDAAIYSQVSTAYPLLTSVVIPDTVTSIGEDAFTGCSALTSVTIPASVTSIGWSAFRNCDALKDVTINNTLVGSYMFAACGNLATIHWGEKVTTLNDGAFSECTSLTSVTVPATVTKANNAFSYCDGLVEVTVNCSQVYSQMFAYCPNLKTVNLANTVTAIGSYAFSGAGIEAITIPASVTSVGSKAFQNCTSLTTVNYTGTEAQWDAISINSTQNDALTGANINYNYVVTVPVTGITLDQASVKLRAGSTVTLTAAVAPDNATDKTVTWTSSNETVAAVVDGVVTAKAVGEATITAAAGEFTAQCVVTVWDAEAISADWHNFRNSDVNMALTSAKTPTGAETAVLKWAKQLGTGWSAAPSVQIIVDNALVVMCGNKNLYKLDLQTGDILQQTTMTAAPNFGYTPATYADGLIFCPLSGGIIQAFDAKTLDSVWIYKDALGGQSLSPITYADGCVYTGFWNGENKDANYVCVNVSDGSLVWNKTVTGGFYWAGSVVLGDTLIVGTDDGASGYTGDSHLYSLNKDNGTVISDLTLTGCGDQRSSIAYSEAKGRVYFTAKNGYLCSAAVDTATGVLSDLKTAKQASQCTSTPVVYGDQVYFSCGSGVVEGSGGSGNFVVADADTLQQHYAVALKAYPQGSVLVSDAYLEETGKLYCYSTYNGQPGGLSLIKVDPAKDTADGAELVEMYDAKGYEQYCITSPICGKDGTIYYKNDSGNILAVGTNVAYLTGLEADTGKLTGEFAASTTELEWVVPVGTQSLCLKPTACQGATVTVNGGSADTAISLTDGTATATVVVTNGNDTRTYTVSVREVSTDATLDELKVNESNSYTGKVLALDPEFAANTYYYGVYNVGASRSFENVWPTAADANATVAVYALSNVKEGKFDAETGEISVTATNQNHDRYAVYFADDTKPMAVRIVVTAENGDLASYVLVMSKEAAATDGAALLETLKNCKHENCTVTGAQAATCTEKGYTGDKNCADCGKFIVGTVIEALGHTEVTDDAVAPTCTATGLTEGKHCSVCQEVLVKQEAVNALGHTEAIDEAVAPTCTATGLTEGKHCSVCQEVLVKQETVAANGHADTDKDYTCDVCEADLCTDHVEEQLPAVAPTCTATGLTAGVKCGVCGDILVAQEQVAALGHTEVTDEAVAPTCTATGLTEGKHCTVCQEVLVKQEAVNALGHAYKDGVCTVCAEADPNYKTAAGDVDIYVTISNKGNVVMLQQPVTVTDVNHNGIFDVDDALYAAHEAGYAGGAAAGYASEVTQYGLGIAKLWGDTSYCYGYWLNNASCWSLEDAVADGNYLVAFVYADGTNWSDAYTKFEKFDYTATAGEGLTVKLDKAGYDENWNTVFGSHTDAAISVYDREGKLLTEGYAVTDNGDGTYTVTVDTAGSYYLVAYGSDSLTVPAVSYITISAKAVAPEQPTQPSTPSEPATPSEPSNPATGDSTNIALCATFTIVSVICLAALLLVSKKKYSNYSR